MIYKLVIWQEEDLFTMAYGLPLSGDGDEKCLSLLNAVEENISRQLRACKAPSSKRKPLEGIFLIRYLILTGALYINIEKDCMEWALEVKKNHKGHIFLLLG